jgi:predicted amidophosphoribosyltransferase
LGNWWGEELRESGLGERVDCIVPVPLHPSKQRRRGYNQVSQFAKSLSENLSVPVFENALVKIGKGTTQTRKGRWYRWETSRGGYRLSPNATLDNKRVLLVDDVITTGATLEACANAIHTAEATAVYIASMAVVP